VSSEFFRTGMGQKYYEHTLPGLVREIGSLRAALADLTTTIAQQSRAGMPNRRIVLVAHRDALLLRALSNAFKLQHEVHVTRTYATAIELLDLHKVDTIIVDRETGWQRAGPSLFDEARARYPEALCIGVLHGKRAERDAFGQRSGANVVLDDGYPVELVQALEGYLR
jgi:hypothetical protein